MKSTTLILFFWFIFSVANAQIDSLKVPSTLDTVGDRFKEHLPNQNAALRYPDSLLKLKKDAKLLKDTQPNPVKGIISDSIKTTSNFIAVRPLDTIYSKLLNNPFFSSRKKPMYLVINERTRESKDQKFYILLGIMFFLSIIKLGFSRYFNNLFQQLFQPNYRQKQTREQLLQNNFPSLLLNLFFIISGGAFIALLMQYYNLTTADFTTNLAYCTLVLLILYTGKFLLLTFIGWVFHIKDATETYLFIVFLINKIIGIILLPFTFIIAFSKHTILTYSITIAILLIIILFSYRYVATLSPVRKAVKLGIFHFIFYIIAFEIIPLLLIYKTLGNYLLKST